MTDITLTPQDLEGFPGSETFTRHPLARGFISTEGVRFFANQAGAFWFLDILATEVLPLGKHEAFLAITLEVPGPDAPPGAKPEITVTDGNETTLWHRIIPFTDCPPGVWRFFMAHSGEPGVMTCMLPGEY